MSKLKLTLFAALAAVIFLSSGVKTIYSQTTNSSIQTQAETDAARRIQLVEALERAQDEVRAGRSYISGLESQVKSKQSIIDAQAKKQTLSDEAIASLQKEVDILQATISEQKKTISTQKDEIEYLKKQLSDTNKKLHRSRKLNQFLIVGIAAAVLASILK